MPLEAYLDIETTGLSRLFNEVTVIGVYLVGKETERLVQLFGENVTRDNLLKLTQGAHTIYTYNGSRFDLPFIATALGVDLTRHSSHIDLMYDCWQNGLYGGLKRVEKTLGISRQLPDMDGYKAVVLWWQYVHYGDERALTTLLKYNEEDVINLRTLRQRLRCRPDRVRR